MTAGTGIPGLGGCWQPVDLEAVRAALADNGIDGPDLPYNPREMAAMRAADQLLAEVDRLRPVVEAAQAWRRMRDGTPTIPKPESAALISAVDAYEAAGGEVR